MAHLAKTNCKGELTMQKDAMRKYNESELKDLLYEINLTLDCAKVLESLIESNNQKGFNYFTSCCNWTNKVIRSMCPDINRFLRTDNDTNTIKNAILQIAATKFELKLPFPKVKESTFGKICEEIGTNEDAIRGLYIKHIANSHDNPVLPSRWYSWTDGKYADFPVEINSDGAIFINGKQFLDCLKQLIGVRQKVIAYLQSLS